MPFLRPPRRSDHRPHRPAPRPFFQTPDVNCCLVGCCSRGARTGKPLGAAQQQPTAGPSPARRKRHRITIAWIRPNTKAATATSKAPPLVISCPVTLSSFAAGARGRRGRGWRRGREGDGRVECVKRVFIRSTVSFDHTFFGFRCTKPSPV